MFLRVRSLGCFSLLFIYGLTDYNPSTNIVFLANYIRVFKGGREIDVSKITPTGVRITISDSFNASQLILKFAKTEQFIFNVRHDSDTGTVKFLEVKLDKTVT